MQLQIGEDSAVKLNPITPLHIEMKDNSYILLHIFLSSIYSTFANLETHLGSVVVHESPECGMRVVPTPATLLLLLPSISISTLGLRGRLRRWRRSQLRNRGNVLWDGMVERR